MNAVSTVMDISGVRDENVCISVLIFQLMRVLCDVSYWFPNYNLYQSEPLDFNLPKF